MHSILVIMSFLYNDSVLFHCTHLIEFVFLLQFCGHIMVLCHFLKHLISSFAVIYLKNVCYALIVIF